MMVVVASPRAGVEQQTAVALKKRNAIYLFWKVAYGILFDMIDEIDRVTILERFHGTRGAWSGSDHDA